MSIQVRNYLKRLEENRALKRNDRGFILEDGKRVYPINNWSNDIFKRTSSPYTYIIDGRVFYSKIVSPDSHKMTNEIFVGRAFNDMGVNSTIAYPMLAKYTPDANVPTVNCVVTQDLDNLNNGEIITADAMSVLDDMTYEYNFDSFAWSLVVRPEIKAKLLTIMTEECYEKFVNLFLLDNLISSIDRHGQNFKFVKNSESKLWEDVVALDNELLAISAIMNNRQNKSSENFIDFLNEEFVVYYPFNYDKNISHAERIKLINNLIASGDLDNRSIEFLKSAIEYDLPKTYKKVHQNYDLSTKTIENYDIISRLWDYNRETLELN